MPIYSESDGASVQVTLSHTITGNEAVYVQGWVGLPNEEGDSGDTVAINIDHSEYRVLMPAALSVSKGDVVYVTIADVTGHEIDDDAFSTSAGAGKIPFLKATADKDASHYVSGILLSKVV